MPRNGVGRVAFYRKIRDPVRMKIHILGICGTFMGGIAAIATELGHEVSGSDLNVYPPMSDTLAHLGITLSQGYLTEHLQPTPELVIIGNALSRGNPAVEYVLNNKIPYISGPQWLAEQVLSKRHVLAVAGTHGKTTTTSMLAWILEYAGKKPGFLIGGVAEDFQKSARLGQDYFVIEADEYDTAFFDKRSKLIHYHPNTFILNNVEFDHADIFADLDAIQTQFHYGIRTVPGDGLVISNAADANVSDVLARGCWSRQQTFGSEQGWSAQRLKDDCSAFEVYFQGEKEGDIQWSMIGRHNMSNALAAIAAAKDIGVTVAQACLALNCFQGIKRRLELRGRVNDIAVYDDFAHHPTAIRETVDALRARVGQQRIIAVLQFGSNTMKLGEHSSRIAASLENADQIVFLQPENFVTDSICKSIGDSACHFSTVDDIINNVTAHAKPQDNILIMSNRGFDNIHTRLLTRLESL